MISRTRKINNKLKRSIKKNKYIGGLTSMKGKYGFFCNKSQWIKLFGQVVENSKAPSISNIDEQFSKNGYRIENNTNLLHWIGWENLTTLYKKQNYPKSYNGKSELDKIVNLDDDNEIRDALLSSIFSKNKYDCCVVIHVEQIKSNKYIKLVEKEIIVNIPKEPTLSDELREPTLKSELKHLAEKYRAHLQKFQNDTKHIIITDLPTDHQVRIVRNLMRKQYKRKKSFAREKQSIVSRYNEQTENKEQIEDLSTDSNEQIEDLSTDSNEQIDDVNIKDIQNSPEFKRLSEEHDIDLLTNSELLRISLLSKKTKLGKKIVKNHYMILRNEINELYSQKIKNIKKKYSKEQKNQLTAIGVESLGEHSIDNDEDDAAVEDIQLSDDEHNSN